MENTSTPLPIIIPVFIRDESAPNNPVFRAYHASGAPLYCGGQTRALCLGTLVHRMHPTLVKVVEEGAKDNEAIPPDARETKPEIRVFEGIVRGGNIAPSEWFEGLAGKRVRVTIE